MKNKLNILTLVCDQCNQKFTRTAWRNKVSKKWSNCKKTFCSSECNNKYKAASFIEKPCKNCGKQVKRALAATKRSKTKNIFCNTSCAASYNNTLKRKSRRSKVEIMLFEMLEKEFPNLKFIPNDKKLLDGLEIDIAIPSINLGIEWNGVVHFKPIYGQAKLDRVQELDAKKQVIAQQKGINLIVIPDLVSTVTKVKQAFTSVSKIIRQLTN